MPPSLRDITAPLDEILSLVNTYKIEEYLAVILAVIIAYDCRERPNWYLLFPATDSFVIVCTFDKEVCHQIPVVWLHIDDT